MSSLLDDDFVYQYEPEDFQFVGEKLENDISFRRILLEEAANIVDGDRNKTYGKPEDSYGAIAELWSVYLKRYVKPHDVAAMMILLKVARIMGSNGIHRDSWVDIAGYAACGFETVQSEPVPNTELNQE